MNRLSGDEWYDVKTIEFVKELVDVMQKNIDCEVLDVYDNTVLFSVRVMRRKLVLAIEVWEFGYEGESESVNAMIYGVENGRKIKGRPIPGGEGTRTRNPVELWHNVKIMLRRLIG